jgi:hypothetical protein
MWDGCRRRNERTQRVFVMSGMVNKLAMASATKALRIVEPSCLGSGMIFGLAAGDLDLGLDGIVVENLRDLWYIF